MLKASNAKPEAWESWRFETERRRCGTAKESCAANIGTRKDLSKPAPTPVPPFLRVSKIFDFVLPLLSGHVQLLPLVCALLTAHRQFRGAVPWRTNVAMDVVFADAVDHQFHGPPLFRCVKHHGLEQVHVLL